MAKVLEDRKYKKQVISVAGFCAITSLLVYLLWYDNSYQKLLQLLKNVKISYLAVSFICLHFLQFISARRLLYSLPTWVSQQTKAFFRAVELTYIQQSLARLLPLRLGDVVYLMMVRKYFDVKLGKNLAAYILLRIWDLRIIIGSFVIAGLLNHYSSLLKPAAGNLALYIIVPLVFSMVLFPFFYLRKASLLMLAMSRRSAVGRKLLHKGVRLVLDILFSYKRAARSALWVTHGIWAFMNWALVYLLFYFIFLALNIVLPFGVVIYLTSGLLLLTILPLQSIGGIGIGEVGLSGMLVLYGFQPAEAIAAGLSVGILHTVLSVALLLSYGGYKLLKSVSVSGLIARNQS